MSPEASAAWTQLRECYRQEPRPGDTWKRRHQATIIRAARGDADALAEYQEAAMQADNVRYAQSEDDHMRAFLRSRLTEEHIQPGDAIRIDVDGAEGRNGDAKHGND